ncbi:UNVERIFIED_CONTAM: hypothetical protein Sindi_3050200 [Sesamum indicum]
MSNPLLFTRKVSISIVSNEPDVSSSMAENPRSGGAWFFVDLPAKIPPFRVCSVDLPPIDVYSSSFSRLALFAGVFSKPGSSHSRQIRVFPASKRSPEVRPPPIGSPSSAVPPAPAGEAVPPSPPPSMLVCVF